jgi:hypothetical protein
MAILTLLQKQIPSFFLQTNKKEPLQAFNLSYESNFHHSVSNPYSLNSTIFRKTSYPLPCSPPKKHISQELLFSISPNQLNRRSLEPRSNPVPARLQRIFRARTIISS